MSISSINQGGNFSFSGQTTLSNNSGQSGNMQRSSQKSGGAANSEDPAVENEVRNLKEQERDVRVHENAHKSAGGPHAGSVSYTYTRGSDGKMYITGGEVSIDVSEESTPAATIRKMEQVKAAALAPADPSSQDQSVAAKASIIAMRARSEESKLKEAEMAEANEGSSQKGKVESEKSEDLNRELIKHISVYA